ncbi:MAG: hypothetical protein ACRC50_13905 [Gaiella sp.]
MDDPTATEHETSRRREEDEKLEQTLRRKGRVDSDTGAQDTDSGDIRYEPPPDAPFSAG